jgi:hypothetical protein
MTVICPSNIHAHSSGSSLNNDRPSQSNTLTTGDYRTRLEALSLISDCYQYIMDSTTNVVVVRFHCNHTVLYEMQVEEWR